MKALLLAIVLAVVAPAAAVCCSCLPPPPVADAYAATNVVFAGRCLSGKVITEQVRGIEMKHREFTFEITRLWKGGIDKKEVTVKTGFDGAICGYHFQPGTSYILYCSEKDGVLFTGLCTRTCAAGDAKGEAEVRELDTAAAKAKPQ